MATRTRIGPRAVLDVAVREFFRMGEAGGLAPDARIELIEGAMIDMPPIAPPHAAKPSA